MFFASCLFLLLETFSTKTGIMLQWRNGELHDLFFTSWHVFYFFFFKIYLFLERGEGREEERERNIRVWLPLVHPLLGTWPTTQACGLTGNRTSGPLIRRPALNPLSHTSQG